MADTLKDILPILKPLVFVEKSDDLAVVRTRLELHAVSRLPVLEGARRRAVGIVRRKTLWAGLLSANPPRHLDDVISTDVHVIDADEDIFTATERLRGKEELLVREGGFITHLLTPRGLADCWASYATPFRVVETVERTLRRLLAPFDGARLEEVIGKADLEQLNPSDYELAVRKLWSELPFEGYDLAETCKRLRSFVEFRNQLMHFKRRDHSETPLKELRALTAFLESRLAAARALGGGSQR